MFKKHGYTEASCCGSFQEVVDVLKSMCGTVNYHRKAQIALTVRTKGHESRQKSGGIKGRVRSTCRYQTPKRRDSINLHTKALFEFHIRLLKIPRPLQARLFRRQFAAKSHLLQPQPQPHHRAGENHGSSTSLSEQWSFFSGYLLCYPRRSVYHK